MPAFRVGHHDDWPTLGWTVIDWIETYLCHGPGDVEGDELVLDDEQVQFLLDCYRLYPRKHARAGQRVVSRAVFSRPKGRAKSELAGAVVCAEALGPVRFAGWDAHGDPVAREIRSPFIRCLATEETQSGETYVNVTVMLEHALEAHPELFAGVDIGRNTRASTRIYTPGGGEVRPSTASSSAKDGGKETFSVADETHLYVLASLREMHRTVSRNLRKRKIAEPWMLDTTTAFQVGQQSVAEVAWDMAKALRDGRRKVAAGFYMNHREGHEVANWQDDSEVLSSLREGYGVATHMDLERILSDEIRAADATEEASRRYWLNQNRRGSGLYFDLQNWADRAHPEIVVADGSLIVAGFDGARWDDSTALIATEVATGHQWVAGLWERDHNLPPDEEWEVDEELVTNAVTHLFDTYNVWRLYADPPYWADTIATWQGTWGEKRVVKWWTNRNKAMAFALKAYRVAQQTGEMSHDGDSGFARHIGNAHRVDTRIRDEDGKPMHLVAKERPGSPNKIDAAVAGTISWEARTDAMAAGVLLVEEEKTPTLVRWR